MLIYTQIMVGGSQAECDKGRGQLPDRVRLPPMVAGSLVEQYVTCGKPNCRCSRGQKHGPLYYLYWKERGQSRSLYVPRDKVGELRRQIHNYRRFQKQLAERLQRQLRGWQRRLQEERQR